MTTDAKIDNAAPSQNPDSAPAFSEEVVEKAKVMLVQGLEVQDFLVRSRTFPACFSGADAVRFLVEQQLCKSEGEAVAIGGILLQRGVFLGVPSVDVLFQNSSQLFRFAGSVLRQRPEDPKNLSRSPAKPLAGAPLAGAGVQAGSAPIRALATGAGGQTIVVSLPVAAPIAANSNSASSSNSAAPAEAKAAAERRASDALKEKEDYRSQFDIKLAQFEQALNVPGRIDEKLVRSFAFNYGTPDKANTRALVWKLLLYYLPLDRSQWDKSLKTSRAGYQQWVTELTINPYAKIYSEQAGAAGAKKWESVSRGDDPLSQNSNEWKEFYRDQDLRHEIEKDVKRTYSSFHFFNQAVNPDSADTAGAAQSAASANSTATAASGTNANASAAAAAPAAANAPSNGSAATTAAEAGSSAGAGSSSPGSPTSPVAPVASSPPAATSPTDPLSSSAPNAGNLFPSSSPPTDLGSPLATSLDSSASGRSMSDAAPIALGSTPSSAPAAGSPLAAAANGTATAPAASTTAAVLGGAVAAARRKVEPAELPSLFDPKKRHAFTPVISQHTAKSKDKESHHDVLQRILFIYAKLNPGIRYVQGMNEVLAPIYFVFAKDTNPMFKGFAEPDAFYCFTTLMSEIRDRFIKTLDMSSSGIIAVVRELNDMLQQLDHGLWAHLESNGVDPRFYSFRWLTLLLSQEFELPDVLRLWDSLFADRKRFQFLNYCCCAMLILVRDQLMQGDFADNLRLLQHYPPTDLLVILGKAQQLHEQTAASIGNGDLKPSSFFEKPAEPAKPTAESEDLPASRAPRTTSASSAAAQKPAAKQTDKPGGLSSMFNNLDGQSIINFIKKKVGSATSPSSAGSSGR